MAQIKTINLNGHTLNMSVGSKIVDDLKEWVKHFIFDEVCPKIESWVTTQYTPEVEKWISENYVKIEDIDKIIDKRIIERNLIIQKEKNYTIENINDTMLI